MIRENSIASMTDSAIKRSRRQLVEQAKRVRKPLRIIEREIYRRSSHKKDEFIEGQFVQHVVNGSILTGKIVEKDDFGALVEREDLAKPVYILYFYLRPNDDTPPVASL